MTLYKVSETAWESGDPALVAIFIENTDQGLLDKLKNQIVQAGIDEDTVHTLFFVRLKFGIIFIEEGTFKAEYSDNPPDHITAMEDNIMGLLLEGLVDYRWDALWYKDFFSTLDEDFIGLANHMVGFTDNYVDFCYVSTEDKPDEPILFFKNCKPPEAETSILSENSD